MYLCAKLLLLGSKSENKPVIDVKYNSGDGIVFWNL